MNVQNVGINGRNEYLKILDAAWRAHLRPRDENALTIISAFAGAGGSSLGYSMAGCKELLAVEWNDRAIETFRLNFPDIPIYHGDIAELSVDECLRLAGIKVGVLDILDGSSPCQGFSTAGKRRLDDNRNSLFREYVRLLRGIQPKAFIMENVSGMVKGKMKLIFAEAMRELKAGGYNVKCWLLNAMYFGVPQSRERLIWIGFRNDLQIEPSPLQSRNIGTKVLGISQIIDDAIASRSMKINPWIYHPRPAATITKTKSDYQIKMKSGQIRRPSDDEAALLSAYPSGFRWADDKYKWAQIGNSVPPLFMRAIASHVAVALQRLADMGCEPELME